MCIFATTFQYLGQENKLKPLFSNNIKIFRIMKKYLMTGVAALAICAAFTSCSKNEELYNQDAIDQMNVEKITQTYNEAFIKVFGQPSANQDWGFGSTRTRGVYADGNEWAASDGEKWRVPPVLTADQKKVVIKYFQTVKNPQYQDPQWKNYFIQQVYKGGDAPLAGGSPEKYKAADNNTDIVGSEHMDHLAAIDGEFVDHNNNFNKGDCGEYANVLDYKGTLTEVVATYTKNENAAHHHADKINLMTNSTTKSFGYYNSNSSVRRTEYTGLVSYQTIIDALGDEANCLNDGWNRSFMGFDFEMMVGDEVYAKDLDWSTNPATVKDYIWYEFNGEKYHVLSDQQNAYCGVQYKNADGSDITDDQLTDEFISGLLADGYLPVLNSANKKWVKVGGTADGYYSDWIVTLTEAKKYDTTTPPPSERVYTIRVIGEDLTVGGSDEEDLGADFDFNDVVFDVCIDTEKQETWIKLQAAGGTLPLTVDGKEVHNLFGETSTSVMINTGAGPNHDPVEVKLDNYYANAVNIPVYVTKGGRAVELKAVQGKPASKIGVKTSYVWCRERVGVVSQYPMFSQWVQALYPGTIEWY